MSLLWEIVKVLVIPAFSAAVVCIVIIVTLRNKLDALSAVFANFQAAFEKHELDDHDEFRTVRHEFGETASSLRRKIEEVEDALQTQAIFNRDTFLRRDSFYEKMRELVAHIDDVKKELQAWLLRIETKLDTKT